MLDGGSTLATSAIYLITMVPVCFLGLTLEKVTLNHLIHPSKHLCCTTLRKLYHGPMLWLCYIYNTQTLLSTIRL